MGVCGATATEEQLCLGEGETEHLPQRLDDVQAIMSRGHLLGEPALDVPCRACSTEQVDDQRTDLLMVRRRGRHAYECIEFRRRHGLGAGSRGPLDLDIPDEVDRREVMDAVAIVEFEAPCPLTQPRPLSGSWAARKGSRLSLGESERCELSDGIAGDLLTDDHRASERSVPPGTGVGRKVGQPGRSSKVLY